MAYDVSNFSDFISRENKALTKTLFTGGDTGKFALYMANVKGSTSVPHVSGAATLQSGNCATPSGDAVINEVVLTVKPFTVFESFCSDDLQTKLPNTVLAPGSNNGDDLPFEEEIVNTKVASIAETLEMTYWQGNTASGSTYQLFDGFIKLIDADSNVIDGNTSGATAITKDNVKGLVEDMRIAAPAKVKRSKDYVTLVGDDVFDMYISKEKSDNLYHYKPEHDNGVYEIGGGHGKLIRVYGLDGTSRMFASVGSNFIVGSDVISETETIEAFYDKTLDKVMLRTKGKAGVQISNADEIVEFTLTV
ncbi:hypothetical protein [Pseudotamlana agarivorans]|uniref:hypothetical protein n=1 Tax=Pseudotamlana agarivorans TaxID=481183 RepID=UPI00082F2C22|nr:hypothetical protein [Tamlana agarivorans]